MAFITSASSVYLDVQLTNYGRGVVLTGDLQSRISKFTLSDTDIDYRQPTSTGHTATSQGGLIPDISGNHINCSKGINDGVKCSSYIHQTPEIVDSGQKEAQVVVGIDKDMNGVKTYYSEVSVDVYMHDYYALCKLLSLIYSNDSTLLFKTLSSGGASTIIEQQQAFLESFSATSQINNGVFGENTIKTALELIQNKHRGQFLDFWDEVSVNYPNFGRVNENIFITSSNQTYMNNAAALTGRLALKTNTCNDKSGNYSTLQKYNKHGLMTEVQGNNEGLSISPFTLAFSSKGSNEDGKSFKGAGPAGIGFTTTEFGYLNLGTDIKWGGQTDYFPTFAKTFEAYSKDINYDTKKYFLGFVHPVEFENMKSDDYMTGSKIQGTGVSAAGYENNSSIKSSTYGRVKNVLPSLKYGWSTPLGTPYIGGDNDIDAVNANGQQISMEENLQQKSLNKTYSNFYYPIKTTRAQKIEKLLNFADKSWAATTSIKNYHQSTYTDHDMDTFALLGTNFEYTNLISNNQGVEGGTIPSVEALYGISPDEAAGNHYYNWFTRMMSSGDEFFKAIHTNESVGNKSFPTITEQYSAKTSGVEEIDEFNIRIPVSFTIHSSDNSDAIPATCKVNFVYNKLAAKQSIGYSGYSNFSSSQPNVPYWRIYDRALVGSTYGDRKPRFYGEDGETPSEYTTDPTQVSNDGTLTGKRIFRKVLAGGTEVI